MKVDVSNITARDKQIALWALGGFVYFGAYSYVADLRALGWNWVLSSAGISIESFLIIGLFGAVMGGVIGYFATKP